MNNDHNWYCDECGFETKWEQKDYAERGNPVCPDCDDDMITGSCPALKKVILRLKDWMRDDDCVEDQVCHLTNAFANDYEDLWEAFKELVENARLEMVKTHEEEEKTA